MVAQYSGVCARVIHLLLDPRTSHIWPRESAAGSFYQRECIAPLASSIILFEELGNTQKGYHDTQHRVLKLQGRGLLELSPFSEHQMLQRLRALLVL